MKGMTLTQILRNTTASRIELSANVAVRNLKFGISKKLQIPKAIAQCYSRDKGSNGKLQLFKYATMVEFHPGNLVKVGCSCPDHLYRWEYALARRNASYITYSNGEPPTDTNPKLVPGMCKHCVALVTALKKQKLLPKFI